MPLRDVAGQCSSRSSVNYSLLTADCPLMIQLDDITQHYGVRPVLRNISLGIGRGELVVILGPNGMGKTTLLGVMAGALPPQRGTVRIDGLTRRASAEEELA